MTLQSIVFILVAGAAFAYSGYRFRVLYKLLRAQKGVTRPLGHWGARIATFISNVLGQKAVLQKRGAGLIHALIFWGFIIITVGTLEQFASTIYHGASFEFIGEEAYRLFVFIYDLFTIGVLVAVLAALFRRVVIRPPHLAVTRDAYFVLAFTAGLMVSILLMNASGLAGVSSTYADAMPISQPIAAWFSALDLLPEIYGNLAVGFKWIHMLLVLGFAVYIPHSKHLHIIAAAPNTLLRTLDRKKAMTSINFENEAVTQYGAAKVTDMSWKDTLDMYSCTECGRCQELCPAWNTQKPLSPMLLVKDLKNNLFTNKSAILAQKHDEVGSVIDSAVTEDVIWACTSCRACEIACPVFIEHTDKIYDVRRNLVMMESKFPPEVQAVFKNMETNGTPWAFSAHDRMKWAEGLNIKTMADNAQVDALLWVGCAGAFDDRNKKVIRAVASLLKKAGVKFAVLGTEEQCTGDAARRIGNEYLFQMLAKANIETLNRYQVKTIITSCPHCFNTLGNEYPAFGGHYKVIHHSQYLAQLIREGRLKTTESLNETLTFHDSCYMGRWNGEYDAPRDVLKAIPHVQIKEMRAHHDKSFCCGAGGGRMWMEEKIGTRINVARTEQALKTGAKTVATSCPFCLTMLTDGLKAKEAVDRVSVVDIAELLDKATRG